MELTAEVRWFWLGTPPADFEKWFWDPSLEYCRAGGGGERTDIYLLDPQQVELGIKMRKAPGDTEVKGLIQISRSPVSFTPKLSGNIELWCKWKTRAFLFSPHAGISIQKTRWIRKFSAEERPLREIALNEEEGPQVQMALPTTGCNAELTRIVDNEGKAWWSIGFEAFGALALVEHALRSAVDLMLERKPPQLPPGHNASYPKWLSENQFLKLKRSFG